MNRSRLRLSATLLAATLSFVLGGAACAAAVASVAGGAKSAAPASAKDAKPAASAKDAHAKEDVAIFAGGCFWCMETDFEKRPGIKSVISGYTGGTEPNPTYEQVSAHETGHREAVEIHFDPSVISYAQLVDLFWHSIDPTQKDGQFSDIGENYRTAIFYRDAEQKKIAEKSKLDIELAKTLGQPIATEILPAGKFWPAEDYHQDYWTKDPLHYHMYRLGSGRDQRLHEIWGKDAAKPSVH